MKFNGSCYCDDFRKDQKVFLFINSDECQEYLQLRNFLKRNNLPLLERWIFYFYGKVKFINNKVIAKMKIEDSVGFIEEEIYCWYIYFRGEEIEKNIIRENLSEDEKGDENMVNEIFVKNGWEQIEKWIEDEEWERSEKLLNDFDPTINEYSDYTCFGCGENPCTCSDPEKTSYYGKVEDLFQLDDRNFNDKVDCEIKICDVCERQHCVCLMGFCEKCQQFPCICGTDTLMLESD